MCSYDKVEIDNILLADSWSRINDQILSDGNEYISYLQRYTITCWHFKVSE
jgi:hypothetical protein